MKATLIKLSICPCGHPLLKPGIPIGTEYEINPAILAECLFVCGGCKRKQEVVCVFVLNHTGGMPGYLPACAFDLKDFPQPLPLETKGESLDPQRN